MQPGTRDTAQVMSEENVELVRQFLNASIEVDEGLAEASQLHEFFVPDAPIAIDAFTDGGELHGIDEFLELRATWIESYDD